MVLHFNLIVQNNQFHFIPKLHLHLPSNEEDFTVFSASWLCFNFILTNREILSVATYWRDIVNKLVDHDKDTMVRLDALVSNYMKYADEQFARKARWIVSGHLRNAGAGYCFSEPLFSLFFFTVTVRGAAGAIHCA